MEKAREFKDEESPCEFKVFEGDFKDRNVEVSVVEEEDNTQLVGPAGFNKIFVHNGNVLGVPPNGWDDGNILEEGYDTGFTYIGAFSKKVARKIEKMVEKGECSFEEKVKMVETLNDINLGLEKPGRRYVTNNKKKIDVRGPFFLTVKVKVRNKCN